MQKACLEAAEAGLLISAHDCSDGGLAVTLAESCFSSLGRDAIGADVDLKGELGPTALLFSESPSRIVISFDSEEANTIAGDRRAQQCAVRDHRSCWWNRVENRVEWQLRHSDRLSLSWKKFGERALSSKLQAEVVGV